MVINGFIVVRLPQLNFRELNTHPPRRTRIPSVGDIYYAGAHREQWADVFDEEYYAKKTPDRIVSLAKELKRRNDDFTGLDVCQDAAVALELLTYSNRRSNNNELIAVRSPALKGLKGTIDTDLTVEWIGFDFIALGEWSLIAGGMFTYPEHYSAWLTRSNRFGLFDDPSLLTEYALAYEQAVEVGRAEPLAPPSAGYEKIAIEVGRVQIKQ